MDGRQAISYNSKHFPKKESSCRIVHAGYNELCPCSRLLVSIPHHVWAVTLPWAPSWCNERSNTNQPTKTPNLLKKTTAHPAISQTEKKTPKCIKKISYQFKPLKRVPPKVIHCHMWDITMKSSNLVQMDVYVMFLQQTHLLHDHARKRKHRTDVCQTFNLQHQSEWMPGVKLRRQDESLTRSFGKCHCVTYFVSCHKGNWNFAFLSHIAYCDIKSHVLL